MPTAGVNIMKKSGTNITALIIHKRIRVQISSPGDTASFLLLLVDTTSCYQHKWRRYRGKSQPPPDVGVGVGVCVAVGSALTVMVILASSRLLVVNSLTV